MNCPECSGPVEPDQRFCNWCGVKLNAGPAPEANDESSHETTSTADSTGVEVDGDDSEVAFAEPTGDPTDQPPTLIIPVPPELTGDERTALFKPDFTGRDSSGSSPGDDAPHDATTGAQAAAGNVQPAPPDVAAAQRGGEEATEAIPTQPTSDTGNDTAETARAVAVGADEGVASSDGGTDTDDDDQHEIDSENQSASDATAELDQPADADLGPVALAPSTEGSEGDSDSMWSPGYVAAQVVTTPPPPRLEAPLATPPATPYDLAAGAATTTIPSVDDTGSPATMVMPATAAAAAVRQRHGFRMSPLFIVSAIGAIAAIAAMFFKMVEIASDVPIEVPPDNTFGFQLGEWTAGDLAGNLPIAGIIVAVGMIGGAIFAGFGFRWGAGLAGGSGAAAVGVAMLTLGLAQFPIDAAQRIVAVPSEQQYILSITRDVGYWLQVATAAVGLVALWASFADARADHRRSLNPWIAALGALATLVAAIGPMVPVNQGLISDNWYLVNSIGEPSQLLIIARLVQIAMFALTGIVGFLIVSRYGLGLVFGGTLAAAWLTISTVLELTDNPVGFAFRNPGEAVGTMQVHGVTIIGIAATLAAGLIACAAVLEQNARKR